MVVQIWQVCAAGRARILACLLVRGCLLRRWYLGLGEMTKLPQAVVLRQFWFWRERG